jgi:LysM repeat protein
VHRSSPRRRRDLFTTVPVAVTGALAVTLGAPAAATAAELKPREGVRQSPTSFGHTEGSLARAVSAPPAPRITVQPVAAAQATTHTVAEGDTITGIAIRHALRTVDVLTWNGLSWSSTIYPGQVLKLTAGGEQPAAAAPAPASVESGNTERSHTVASGETVWSIAQQYDTSVSRLVSLNSLNEDGLIFPGQKLVVASNTVSTGETTPPAPAPAPEEEPAPAPAPEASPQQETYIVQAGDTLWSIAQEHGIGVSELLAANGLSSTSIIYPGQKLVIPSAGATPQPQGEQEQPEQKKETPRPPSIYDEPQEQLSASLNAPQSENARMIVRIGRELGIPDKGIAIALSTAMVESGLRNLDWGDRDSLGLFQQRPSTGWGTEDQILDRDRSIRAFFGGPNDPNGQATRGLLDIPGWQSMGFGEAAQTVQISAFPDRYERWRDQAFDWLAQIG